MVLGGSRGTREPSRGTMCGWALEDRGIHSRQRREAVLVSTCMHVACVRVPVCMCECVWWGSHQQGSWAHPKTPGAQASSLTPAILGPGRREGSGLLAPAGCPLGLVSHFAPAWPQSGDVTSPSLASFSSPPPALALRGPPSHPRAPLAALVATTPACRPHTLRAGADSGHETQDGSGPQFLAPVPS